MYLKTLRNKFVMNVGFPQISPSTINFFNIYDIPTTLKIHWAMIKTCLYAAGANLNQIWVPNAIFLNSVSKWVACDQVGRICQVGRMRPSGSHDLQTLSTLLQNTILVSKHLISTSMLRIFANELVFHFYT